MRSVLDFERMSPHPDSQSNSSASDLSPEAAAELAHQAALAKLRAENPALAQIMDRFREQAPAPEPQAPAPTPETS